MKYLKEYALGLVALDEREWEQVESLYRPVTFRKGEMIFRAGEVCRHSYYLASGRARSFGIDAYGRDFTWAVHISEGDQRRHNVFLGDYASLIDKQESDIHCEALEACSVYVAEYARIEALYASGLKWMTLAKAAAEAHYLFLSRYQRMLKRLNARDRYLALRDFAPEYEQALADYQFASLLDITPQSLCRIKKQLGFEAERHRSGKD